MLTRLFGVAAAVALLALGVLAGPAVAGEDLDEDEMPGAPAPHEGLPSLEEVVADSERAQQYLPEEAEGQPFTEALVYPLMIVGFLALLVIGTLYLKWQPEFERQDQQRR